jgi:hypothetical protein
MDGFWLVNPFNMFDSFAIVPTKDMTKSQQFNSLTRLLILVCIIMFWFEWDQTFVFGIFGLMLIVISYYSQMDSRTPTTENFGDCYVDRPVHLAQTGPRIPGFGPETLNVAINAQKTYIATPADKDFKLNLTKGNRHGRTPVSSIDAVSGNAVSSHGYMSRSDVNSLFEGGDRVCIGTSKQPFDIPTCRGCSMDIIDGWCQGCGMGQESLVDDKNRSVADPNGGLGNDARDAGKCINRVGEPPVWYRTGDLQEEKWPQAPGENEYTEFIYDRLDPQMVRNPETLDPARAAEMPHRSPWTRKMGRYEAVSNTVPINSIGDMNFDEYTVGYKAYKDLPGPYKYQAPEAVYQYPNFSRSNVDHILFLNPMYGVMSEQRREPTLNEARNVAESQWLHDTQNSRMEIMESVLDRTASTRMQQKLAPMGPRKVLNNSFG